MTVGCGVGVVGDTVGVGPGVEMDIGVNVAGGVVGTGGDVTGSLDVG